MMELIELYKKYREAQMELVNQNIIKLLGMEEIKKAAIALGMIDKKDNIIYGDENNPNFLIDYVIYDHKIEGKNAVEHYIENIGPGNEMEEKVLKALESSYSSLFRIVNISREKHMVFLKDTFNRVKNVRLTDITFSETGDTDILVFARILPFEELNMTSGITLAFPADMEIQLLRMYEDLYKDKSEGETGIMFESFFDLYKTYGLHMNYNNIVGGYEEEHQHQHHNHHHHHNHEHEHEHCDHDHCSHGH